MALSIISYDGRHRGLWCSVQERFIAIEPHFSLRGLEAMKHDLEQAEQVHANKQWAMDSKEDRIQIMMRAGLQYDEAEQVLRNEAPYLFL